MNELPPSRNAVHSVCSQIRAELIHHVRQGGSPGTTTTDDEKSPHPSPSTLLYIQVVVVADSVIVGSHLGTDRTAPTARGCPHHQTSPRTPERVPRTD